MKQPHSGCCGTQVPARACTPPSLRQFKQRCNLHIAKGPPLALPHHAAPSHAISHRAALHDRCTQPPTQHHRQQSAVALQPTMHLSHEYPSDSQHNQSKYHDSIPPPCSSPISMPQKRASLPPALLTRQSQTCGTPTDAWLRQRQTGSVHQRADEGRSSGAACKGQATCMPRRQPQRRQQYARLQLERFDKHQHSCITTTFMNPAHEHGST